MDHDQGNRSVFRHKKKAAKAALETSLAQSILGEVMIRESVPRYFSNGDGALVHSSGSVPPDLLFPSIE